MSLPFDWNEAQKTLAAADDALAELIEKVGEQRLELSPFSSTFHSLSQSIVYQQLSGKAAATIFSRVQALYAGRKLLRPADVLATSDATLRAAGLSQNKMLALKDLAQKSLDKRVPEPKTLAKLSDDEIVERLVSVRGVGRWTVEMLLIFRLGRPDVFPINDLGIQKGFARTFHSRKRQHLLPAKSTMLRRAEKWRPYRSVASWYLWRATELE